MPRVDTHGTARLDIDFALFVCKGMPCQLTITYYDYEQRIDS